MVKIMTREEAIELLSYHSGRNPDINNPKWKSGFLGILRPFKGVLPNENFIEIMECMKILETDFTEDKIDKEVVANLMGILHYANIWTEKGGMLEKILTDMQKALIRRWTGIISYTMVCLLDHSCEAFCEYNDYMNENL